jgi:hypothetical protein
MSTTQNRLAQLLIDAIRYAETTYDRDGSGEVSGGHVEPAFVTEGVALLREFGFPIGVRPVPPDAVELLHGLVETLANVSAGLKRHHFGRFGGEPGCRGTAFGHTTAPTA